MLVGGQRRDVLSIVSAQMFTADMVPDAAAVWLYHCHISDRMLAGMAARYEVTDKVAPGPVFYCPWSSQ